ncbi:hypothetical protein OF83DRAFT_573918 [Amylostereum chailletii]|nr:hypothetical protein OF83DRAFT_573918 [Amylostereum chailletii]
MSIACALMAIMGQQWARRYTRLCHRTQKEPGLQARIHIHLYEGIKKYYMDIVDLIPSLLHLAVFLFFAGLAQFLFPLNPTVAWAIIAFLLVFFSMYAVFTFHSMFYHPSPFHTPLSAGIWRALPLVRWPYHCVKSFFLMAISMFNTHASASRSGWGYTWKNHLPSPPIFDPNLIQTFAQKVRWTSQGEPELNGLAWMVRNVADPVGRRSAVLYMFLLWTAAQRLETTLISLPGLSDWSVV